MKKLITISAITAAMLTSSLSANVSEAVFNEALGEIEEQIEVLETRSLLNSKIQFGLAFETTMENQSVTRGDGSSYSQDNIWRSYVDINMNSKIADDLQFNGALAMAKNWADSDTHGFEQYDFAQGTKPGDSAVYLKRAYVDWITSENENFTNVVTIGRQPSTDGPSAQFRRNEVRQGTYNALAFDGAVDGVVNSIITSKGTVRLAYGKNTQLHDMNPMNPNPYIAVDTQGLNDTNVAGIFYENDLVTPLGNVWLQLGHTVASDMIASNGTVSKNVGDVTVDTISLEANNIKDTGLSAFAHYGKSTITSNGELVDFGVNGNLGLLTMTMCMDPADPATCATDTSEKTGDAFWVGLSKDLPKNLRATIEYNKGDQYWFNFTQGSRSSVLNKLATRGDAIEVSLSKKFSNGVVLRGGLLEMNYDYAGSGSHLGTPMAVEDMIAMGMGANVNTKVEQAYLSFMLRF